MRDKTPVEKVDFSDICLTRCGGACCAPWWGIINYHIIKQHGPAHAKAFKAELIQGIKLREKRIVNAYITGEARPRPLFTRPESYNLVVRGIEREGERLKLELILMFAFRCSFLSDNNSCQIHPTVIGGPDIRPPHCGALGSPGQRHGEEGYCPVIGVAEKTHNVSSPQIDEAIQLEKRTAESYLAEGVQDMETAASRVVEQVLEYCRLNNITGLSAAGSGVKKIGRNEPCHCGSGRKYKKCHGA